MTDPVSSSSTTQFLLPGNTNRMFGLASGLDIDSIVGKLMQAEEVPLNQLKQQQQLLQWQQDDYRSMNSLLLDLYNTTFDMTLQSSYLAKSAQSSDETAVSAVASTNAGNGSYQITSGTVAKAANIQSAQLGAGFDPNKSLWENRGALANGSSFSYTEVDVVNKDVSVAADGTTFSLGDQYLLSTGFSNTVEVKDSSGTVTGTYNVYFDENAYNADPSTKKVFVNATTGEMTFGETLAAGSTINIASYSYATNIDLSATITAADANGNLVTKNFSFTADQTLNDVINAINSSGLNVTAFYGGGNRVISITNKNTGNLSATSPELFVSGTLLNTNLGFSTIGAEGSDATLTVNGATLTSRSNTISVNGVTFTVKKDFTSPVSVNITDDSSAVFDKIKAWVDKYNDTIQKINDKLNEKRYRDYPPLTDAQKKEMSDKDIEQWNEKAMSGMLANDTILRSGLDQMRMDIYSAVKSVSDSAFDQLADIGITTSSDYTENGKLIIDETKLKAAIAANPQAVMNLFTNSGDAGGTTVYDNEGIMQRLRDTIKKTMDNVYQKAGKDTYTYDQYSLGKMIHEYDDRIAVMMDHLKDVQDRYYAQFTAMEQAIQQANMQGAFLLSNFGGGA